MKNLDKLIQRTKEILQTGIERLFPGDDDGFMEALGVKQEDYVVELPDGAQGYDFLKALEDTAPLDWEE